MKSRIGYWTRVARVLPAFYSLKRSISKRTAPTISRLDVDLLTTGTTTLSKGKYLKLSGYLRRDLGRAVALGLHRGPARRVVDLGCGVGYFLAVCRHFGHRALGLDAPPEETDAWDVQVMRRFYREMVEALEVDRVSWKIAPRVELPELPGGPFDVVTANQASFHHYDLPEPWGAGEWRFFIEDLWRQTAPGGRLVMFLNAPEGEDQVLTEEVRRCLEGLGAAIDGRWVRISRPA
ncbi:MAG: class I SAM-dependent methyltransferase [bacterium]|nr:class I SAM-dependent methyltransferase [bacterium]